ncbi:MAG: chromate resistance protein [Alphaproteobacteria bacterium]
MTVDPRPPALPPSSLLSLIGTATAPVIVDVRREPAFISDDFRLPAARRGDPESVDQWAADLPSGPVLVYCVHGHEVSQNTATRLIQLGRDARYLEGGIDGWKELAYPTVRRLPLMTTLTGSLWITRERPKIDRLACPWLIRRFIDPDARILYVPTAEVLSLAQQTKGIAFDIPGAPISHEGEFCSFDSLLRLFSLKAPGLDRLAAIIRGADTSACHIAAEAAGLLALSLGLSRVIHDDQALLQTAITLYDGLYAWCRDGQTEAHEWPPKILAKQGTDTP